MTKQSWHYSRDDLVAAIRAVGIGTGDVVSLQVSLGRIGLPRDVASNQEALSNFVIDAFLEVIGPAGTLIVPTYTYSIGRGEVFEVEMTPSTIGAFAETFRRRQGIVRSRDPMLSSAGFGPHARAVLRDISQSCYGEGSTFHRLRDLDAKICTLGISLYWATFRHHIEEMAGVPFRFRKQFDGMVREEGRDRLETWTYFAAPLLDQCEPVGLPLERRARAARLVAVAPIGRGEIMTITARDYFDFGVRELRREPWLTARGPACDLEELIRLDDERIGAPGREVGLAAGASMRGMIDAVWALRRDQVSSGYDAALAALARQIPMNIHNYPAGTKCGDWIVPEKWTCRSGRLERIDGSIVFSTADNALHVASRSHSFSGEVARAELFDHLHVHPVTAKATPHIDLLGRRSWGLCCSDQTRQSLRDDRFRVKIDAAFSFAAMKIGEVVVPGRSRDCIVLSVSLDTPMQVNNGLSGVVVGIDVMRALRGRSQPHFTYRLLIAPAAIGLPAFLSDHSYLLAQVRGAMHINFVGLAHPLMLWPSSRTGSFEGACLAALERSERGLQVAHGFNNPAIEVTRSLDALGVPVVTVTRADPAALAKHGWPFVEYRSDSDNPNLTSIEHLAATRDALLGVIETWERELAPSAEAKV